MGSSEGCNGGGTVITYQDLIEAVSNNTQVEERFVRKVLNDAIGVVGQYMAVGVPVKMTNLGTFHRELRAARTGVNPKTHERMQLPDAYVVRFQVSNTLKKKMKALIGV